MHARVYVHQTCRRLVRQKLEAWVCLGEVFQCLTPHARVCQLDCVVAKRLRAKPRGLLIAYKLFTASYSTPGLFRGLDVALQAPHSNRWRVR